eukprot:COSAG05_NODE_584_length_8527_cov_46.366279_7_plen_130_part_00
MVCLLHKPVSDPSALFWPSQYLRERHKLSQAQVEEALLRAHAPRSESVAPVDAATTTADAGDTCMVGYYNLSHVLFSEREPRLASFYTGSRGEARTAADAARAARVQAMDSNRNFVKNRAGALGGRPHA